MSKRMLAVTWMMPPLVFPRSLQISRIFRALHAQGWSIRALAVPIDLEKNALIDLDLADIYADSYQLDFVEPREEVQPSPPGIKIHRNRNVAQETTLLSKNWVGRATARAGWWIRQEFPKALVTFGQPWVNHQVGLQIKKQFPHVPWIAHFSDPWVDSPYYHGSSQEMEIAKQTEQKVIREADRILFTNEDCADLVMARFPESWRTKVSVIGHSTDETLVSSLEPAAREETRRILHAGNLYEGREPFALLEALAKLAVSGRGVRFTLDLVGSSTAGLVQRVRDLDLSEKVRFSPPEAFMKNLARCKSADLLLVIDAPAARNMFLPSKIFDYLPLGRPMLALTPPIGATAEIFKKLQLPQVSCSDPKEILRFLMMALDSWEQGREAFSVPAPESIVAFRAANRALSWEQEIEKAADRIPRPLFA